MARIQMLIMIAVLTASPVSCYCDTTSRDYWPTKEWRSSSPEIQGMSTSYLKDMDNSLTAKGSSIDSVLVVRHGYIVFERYYKKSSQDLRELASVTKSVISALLGIAIDLGLVKGVDQKLTDFFPDSDDSKIDSSVKRITLRHLMTMSVAFTVFPNTAFVNAVLEMPLAKDIGKYFMYEASDPQMISIILTRASSLSAADFASTYLFKPIGVRTYAWEGSQGYSEGHVGLSLRPRDMARLGYLYLNQGSWDGKQVIYRKWIDESTKNQVSDLMQFESLPALYGYYWWLGRVSGYDFYSAVGSDGQTIAVIPGLDIVLVTIGTAVEYLLENYTVPAVIK